MEYTHTWNYNLPQHLHFISSNNIISSNIILDSSGSQYGIYIESGNNNNYIIGNEISGAGFQQEIQDDGTGNVIQQSTPL